MRGIRFLFCVLVLITIQMGAQVNSGAFSELLRVQYTGRLFGYYRIEPEENANDNLPPVKKFLIMRRAFGDERNAPLLLGMGDNFAPEMGASLQRQHLGTDCALAAGPQVPESLYKTSDRYARRAKCDNVVNFLLQAGYRALVPGREDFTYSAAWLHRISLLIRQTHSSHNNDTKLALLAANARLGLAKKCPLLFSDNLSGKDGETCTEDNLPDRLDWLERLDRVSVGKGIRGQVEKAAERTFGSYTLLGNEARAMDSMLPQRPEWRPLRKVLAELYENDYKLSNLKPPARATDFDYHGQLHHITDATQVLLCTLKNKSAATVCKPATPAKSAPDFEASIKDLAGKCGEINSLLHAQVLPTPALLWDNDICIFGVAMLREHERILEASVSTQATKVSTSPLSPDEVDAGKQALLRGIADEQNDIGYTEATVLENGKPKSVLIIGVIGQQTMKAISSTNATICIQKPDGNSEPLSERIVSCQTAGALQGKVKIIDPVRTTRAILRAAEVVHGKYDYRILMAQMPRTEATELASRLDFCSGETLPGVETPCGAAPVPRVIIPQVALVLSEAQSGHVSSNFEMQYGFNGLRWSNIPVLTPVPAYDIVAQNLVRPDTTAFLTATGPLRTVCNAASDGSAWSCQPLADRSIWLPFDVHHSALDLLMSAVEHANSAAQFSIPAGVPGVPNPLRADNCKPDSALLAGCEISVIQFLLQSMQERGHTDMAILQRRDIFLGKLPDKYDDYLVCEPLGGADRTRCELRMALDRVLWKGDYSELAMLPGKDIASLMAAASNQNSLEQTLEQTDISGQWLVAFGIVTSPALNLSRSQPSADEFFVTHDDNCNDTQERAHPSAGGTVLYCVNGVPLLADHSYSISTTDYLDQTAVLPKQPADYYSPVRDFLTKTIADAIFNQRSAAPPGNATQMATSRQTHGLAKIEDILFHPDRPAGQDDTAKKEINHQQRNLFQLDIAKIVAGYSFRAAPKGDSFIASTFQGVVDTRATSPSQSEFDLECKERGLWRTKYLNYGIQSDAAYDRSVQGNLTGLPVNAAYPLNNLSVGGFAEIKLPLGKADPRTAPAGTLKVVLAPYQYQRQINGSYVVFAHTDKTPGQQTLHLSPVNGFSHRAGMRWEEVTSGKWFRGDRGTYYEVGTQISVLNDVLAAVTLTTLGTPAKTCAANSTQTILNCFKQANFPVNANTTVAALPATVHSPGLYWDVHFQKTLVPLPDKSGGPGISLQIDTKGDYFIPRDATKTLSTQTLYDVPVSAALAFPLFKNFSVGPNYQVFFYGNQVASQHLIVNSFSLTGRWFFDRDAAVRLRKQVVFKGPGSADETKTARMK